MSIRGNFNFVFRGIASIAATVASPFTRKRDLIVSPASTSEGLSGNPSHPAPEHADVISSRPPLDHASLKRKAPHDGFDERTTDENAYPNNLRNIYSPKRSRTPSSKPEEHSNPLNVSESPLQVQPAPTSLQAAVETVATPVEDAEMEQNVAQPIRTPSPPPAVERQPSPPPAPVQEAVVEVIASTPPATPPPASKPPTFTPTSNAFASPGFAAFAGSASPFASVKKTSNKKFRAALWSVDSDSAPATEGSAFKNGLGSAFGEKDAQEADPHAISAAKPALIAPASTCTTGEEGEDVEKEVKGVKLFVKRGNKPFASGMVGHLKLLSDKTTQAERLLFRREPLWQVSMNVRVTPTTRCVYDPEESVIRLTLKERASEDSTELVIYALKPGRGCSKQDFKGFAESLVNNSGFKHIPPIL